MNSEYTSKLDLPGGSKSPPLGIIVRRILWDFVWVFLYRPFPRRIGNNWRAALLRIFGAQVGRGVLLSPSMKVMKPWELSIGDLSAIGSNVVFYNFTKISVGSMTVISQDCYLCAGTHDYSNPTMPLITRPISIGSDVWIAAGVFIQPGVEIGNGAVVGARSVVTKNVSAWVVCAGNPARAIKARILSSQT